MADTTRTGVNQALAGMVATARSWRVLSAMRPLSAVVASKPAMLANDIGGEPASLGHQYCCGGLTLRVEEGFPG